MFGRIGAARLDVRRTLLWVFVSALFLAMFVPTSRRHNFARKLDDLSHPTNLGKAMLFRILPRAHVIDKDLPPYKGGSPNVYCPAHSHNSWCKEACQGRFSWGSWCVKSLTQRAPPDSWALPRCRDGNPNPRCRPQALAESLTYEKQPRNDNGHGLPPCTHGCVQKPGSGSLRMSQLEEASRPAASSAPLLTETIKRTPANSTTARLVPRPPPKICNTKPRPAGCRPLDVSPRSALDSHPQCASEHEGKPRDDCIKQAEKIKDATLYSLLGLGGFGILILAVFIAAKRFRKRTAYPRPTSSQFSGTSTPSKLSTAPRVVGTEQEPFIARTIIDEEAQTPMAERQTTGIVGLDGVNDGWTKWIQQKRGSEIQIPKRASSTLHNHAPRIPSLMLPKPTFATVRKASGLPDLDTTVQKGQRLSKAKWTSTL